MDTNVIASFAIVIRSTALSLEDMGLLVIAPEIKFYFNFLLGILLVVGLDRGCTHLPNKGMASLQHMDHGRREG